MRAECLRRLTPEWEWRWTDTDAPMLDSHRVWQSLAYRLNSGPAVDAINRLVVESVSGAQTDLAWVDKAVFLFPETIRRIRESTQRLVHFTPDTAFHANVSRHFEGTITEFDLLVTTKSFEVNQYRKRVSGDRIHLTTQGFDPAVHFPRNTPEGREFSAAFVGLAEPDREVCLAALLGRGIPVRLAGRGWESFVTRWGSNRNLHFAGVDVFGNRYAEMLSRSWIGLGLLSKRFPELHTTRTFEIPACGAVLATEANSETRRFFSDSEAIFYEDYADLATRILAMFAANEGVTLSAMSNAGGRRVASDRRDYPSILGNILADTRLAL